MTQPTPAPTRRPGPAPIPRPELGPDEGFCTKCRRVKPRSAFARNRRRPDGIHPWCMACVQEHCTGPYERRCYRARRDAQALLARRRKGRPSDAPVRAKARTWEEAQARRAAAGA